MVAARVYRLTLLGLVLLSFAAFDKESAEAHSQAEYYPMKWPGGDPGWRFAPSFPGPGAKRERMEEAFSQWTAVPDSFLTFNKNTESSNSYEPSNPCSSDATYNGVFYKTNVAYGHTYHCIRSSGPDQYYIDRFALVMQDAPDGFWDSGAGDGGTNNFKAVALHEVGHAGGFGTKIYITGVGVDQHFKDGDAPCVKDDTYHTMCNGLVPAPAKVNTLEWHDKETVANAY